jgi:tetratricopeptide (TPR) repeat protein
MKCSRCGVESEIEQAFTIKKRWAGLAVRTYCPDCRGKVETRENLVSVVAIVLCLAVLDWLTLRRGMFRLSLDLLFLTAMNFPIIAAHEFSHAIAGSLLGVRVFRVMIGSGRLLASRRAFGITWEWRLWPVTGGTVMACPPQQGNRARFFGAVLAGPALHVLLLFAALAVQVFLLVLQGWFHVDAVLLLHWTGLFIVFNLILLLFNLLPRRAASPSGQIGTDGWQLLHLLFMKEEEEQIRVQSYYVMGAMEASLRNDAADALRWVEQGLAGFPKQPALLAMQGEIFIRKKKYAEARGIFFDLLASEGSKNPFYKYLMYNNIAYADALTGDPALLPEADRYSAEACRQLPWEPSIVGTRGTVLVEMNRLDEGIGLLKEALAKQKTMSGKAADAYHLSVGEGRRGNAEESRRYLDLARTYDPELFLLDPVES